MQSVCALAHDITRTQAMGGASISTGMKPSLLPGNIIPARVAAPTKVKCLHTQPRLPLPAPHGPTSTPHPPPPSPPPHKSRYLVYSVPLINNLLSGHLIHHLPPQCCWTRTSLTASAKAAKKESQSKNQSEKGIRKRNQKKKEKQSKKRKETKKSQIYG